MHIVCDVPRVSDDGGKRFSPEGRMLGSLGVHIRQRLELLSVARCVLLAATFRLVKVGPDAIEYLT